MAQASIGFVQERFLWIEPWDGAITPMFDFYLPGMHGSMLQPWMTISSVAGATSQGTYCALCDTQFCSLEMLYSR
jgi:hypothetical protein